MGLVGDELSGTFLFQRASTKELPSSALARPAVDNKSAIYPELNNGWVVRRNPLDFSGHKYLGPSRDDKPKLKDHVSLTRYQLAAQP